MKDSVQSGKSGESEVVIALQSRPTEAGFDILPINAGEAKGHGVTFSADVLKQSLAMWDGLPCFLDHSYDGSHSVRNLAGALHLPIWNDQEQGIQAALVPGGPGAADLQALRLAAKSDPALMAAVGFSAHLYIVQENGQVKKINRVVSVDCVIDPARGGKFLQSSNKMPDHTPPSYTTEEFAKYLHSIHHTGESIMKIKVKRNGSEIEIEESEILPTDERIAQLVTPPSQ